MWTVLISNALAQDEDAGETAVDEPGANYIETIKVEQLPSGVTQTTAYVYADRVSFISSGNPDTNYGLWLDVYFGNQPGGYGAMRPFFHFPVEQLPSGATITSSYFKLYLKSVSDTQSRQYNAYALGNSWDELSITWNNRPSRSGTVAWNAYMSDTIGWHSTDATNLTRDWYNNPGGNHGVELEGEEGANVHTRVYSANRSLNAPYLEVIYTTNTTPPDAWITTISPYVNANGANWTSSHFNIAWAATDHSGTGIKWYDMYYTSDGGANWTVGQAQVTHTSTPFGPLTHNITYGFYVRARDNTDLEGPVPNGSGSIQQSVRIDGIAPVVAIHDLPAHSNGSGATLDWSGGADDGSGIQNYDVQWRVAGGDWVDLLTATTLTSYDVSGGTNGVTYEFRARGRDMVGNAPDWSTVHTTFTTVWLEPTAYIYDFQSGGNSIAIYSKNPVGPEDGDSFRVLWAGDAVPNTSIVSFSLRYQKPDNPTWITWHTDINASVLFDDYVMTADTTEFPDGIYIFQVKAKDSAGTEGQYHEETQGTIVVDREPPWMTDNQVYLPMISK
jgi:hypothetical protein